MSDRLPELSTAVTPRAPWLYALTRRTAVLGLRAFYRRIEVVGGERLEVPGPVLLVANHPNYMVDPVAIGAQTERQIHFIAKGPLVERYPLLSRFLRAIGVVPVYRREDDPTRTAENQQAFRHAAEVFERGGAICIFAEGRSHPEPVVRALRTGAARILLEAQGRRGGQMEVTVLPVALYFAEANRWGSDGVVVVGEPVETDAWQARYAEDPLAAVRGLTEELQRALRNVALHMPDPDWARFVAQMLALRDAPPRSAAERLQQTQDIASAAERLRAERPAEAEALREAFDEFAPRAEAYRRHEVSGEAEERRGRRVRDAVALPLAALGALLALPPALLALGLSARLVRQREKRPWWRFVISIPAFAAWYAWLWRRSRAYGVGTEMVIAGAPAAALLALRWDLHRRRWLDAWRPPRRRDRARRGAALAAERDALLARFEPWLAPTAGASDEESLHPPR